MTKGDAKQWAVAGNDDILDDIDTREDDIQDLIGPVAAYRSDRIGQLNRFMETLRGAIELNQVTAGSEPLAKLLGQFREAHVEIADAGDDIKAIAPAEISEQYQPTRAARGEIPMESRLHKIKKEQDELNDKMVQRIQGYDDSQMARNTAARTEASLDHTFTGAEEDVTEISGTGPWSVQGPSMTIAYGPSTTFLHAGREIARKFTLNERKEIAFLLVCRHLDTIPDEKDSNDDFDISHAGNDENSQLFEFLGAEGGTGKSRVIEALSELFASKNNYVAQAKESAGQLLIIAMPSINPNISSATTRSWWLLL